MIFEPVVDTELNDFSALNKADQWLLQSLVWDTCMPSRHFNFNKFICDFVGHIVHMHAWRIIVEMTNQEFVSFELSPYAPQVVLRYTWLDAYDAAKLAPELLIGTQVTMLHAKGFGVCTVNGYDAELGMYRVKPHDPKFCFGGMIEWSATLDQLSPIEAA